MTGNEQEGWLQGNFPSCLRSDDLHVWRVKRAEQAEWLAKYWRLLSEEECAKADRFHFRADHERFVVARGVLRLLLASYLNQSPQSLRFDYGPYGKPVLQGQAESLNFNLSHSQGLILYAIIRHRQVGIDVEHLRANVDCEGLARDFFSEHESSALLKLSERQRTQAFFRCWTRKEAYVKAVGAGLSIPLDQFAVSLEPEQPATLLYQKQNPQEVRRWALQDLTPGDDYLAALAVEGSDWHLTCFDWPGNLPLLNGDAIGRVNVTTHPDCSFVG